MDQQVAPNALMSRSACLASSLLFGALMLTACGAKITAEELLGVQDAAPDIFAQADSPPSRADVVQPSPDVAPGPPDVNVKQDSSKVDVSIAPDATNAIACGNNAVCDSVTQSCCLTFQGGQCVPKGTPCQGIAVSCSSPAQCAPKEFCCATLSFSGTTTQCAKTCDGNNNFRLCATDMDCLLGETCQKALGGNFNTCRRPGGGLPPDGGFPGFDGGFPGFDGGF